MIYIKVLFFSDFKENYLAIQMSFTHFLNPNVYIEVVIGFIVLLCINSRGITGNVFFKCFIFQCFISECKINI